MVYLLAKTSLKAAFLLQVFSSEGPPPKLSSAAQKYAAKKQIQSLQDICSG